MLKNQKGPHPADAEIIDNSKKTKKKSWPAENQLFIFSNFLILLFPVKDIACNENPFTIALAGITFHAAEHEFQIPAFLDKAVDFC